MESIKGSRAQIGERCEEEEGNKFIGAGRRMGGDGMEIFYKLVLNESGEGKIFSGPEDEPLQCIDWQ